jgi:DNA-binding transcriptional MerR regulator
MLNNMRNNTELLTIGEFAGYANTTKRTVRFYFQKGILMPCEISKAGYKYYRPEQLIDFQTIYLLRHLNFSIEEIQKYLRQNKSLESLFYKKDKEITMQVERLQNTLNEVKKYYKTLGKTGKMIEAKVKKVKSYEIYYIDKIGPYKEVFNYCLELKNYFTKISKESVFLTLDEEWGFYPTKNKMKVAVIIDKSMKLTKEGLTIVKKMKVSAYKAFYFEYKGSLDFINLQWDYLYECFNQNDFKLSERLHTVEIYRKSVLNGVKDEDSITEIQIPII